MAAPVYPTVTLVVPPMVMQGADIVARAVFWMPPPEGGLLAGALVPTDARFTVRTPSGNAVPHLRGKTATVRDLPDGVQLVACTDEWGEHHVRIDGTMLFNNARVTVSDEKIVFVAASAIV